MIIRWHGQSAFTLTGREHTVAIDPFGVFPPDVSARFRFAYPPIEPHPADIAEAWLAKASTLGVAGVHVCDSPWITRERIEMFHRSRLEFTVWTVDSPARGRELAEWKVDAITTNRAAWMRRQLAQAAESPEFADPKGRDAPP